MLKHQLIHPQINAILGRAGHHGTILIADGNYPASSTLGPNAQLVSLNLAPGLVTCSQVLEVLLDDGEPAKNVPASFADQGQEILGIENLQTHYSVKVKRNK